MVIRDKPVFKLYRKKIVYTCGKCGAVKVLVVNTNGKLPKFTPCSDCASKRVIAYMKLTIQESK